VHEQRPVDRAVLDELGADDPLVVEQTGRPKRLEVAQAIGREGAIDVGAGVEDATLRVPEGTRLEACGRSAGVSGGSRPTP